MSGLAARRSAQAGPSGSERSPDVARSARPAPSPWRRLCLLPAALALFVAALVLLPAAPAQAQVLSITVESAGPGSLKVTWNAVSGAVRYWVDWRVSGSTSNYTTQSVTTTTYTITNLTPGTEYLVQVRAVASSNNVFSVNSATGTTQGALKISAIAITSSPPAGQNGFYKRGDKVEITATFSATITVSGTPKLELQVGSNPRSSSCAAHASDTKKLVCSYTVGGDRDGDGISVGANKLTLPTTPATTIKDLSNNAVTLTHSALAAQSGHKVDGYGPVVTFASATPTVGTAYEITITDDLSKVAAYAVREVAETETSFIGSSCDNPSDDNFSLTPVSPAASPHVVSYTPKTAGKKLCVYARDVAGNGWGGLHGTAIAQTTTTVVPAAPAAQTVPSDWACIPKDSSNSPRFTAGQSFRLLFITSTSATLTNTGIAHYNGVARTSAATVTCLSGFSGQFRAVVSTRSVDARDNTATTGRGVPIYWQGGAKVADDYADFYDNSWDSIAGKRDDGRSAAGTALESVTGSDSDGTKHASAYAGASSVRWGSLQSSSKSPLSETSLATTLLPSGPIYALSPVITVQAASAKPAKPTGLTATAGNAQVRLAWTSPGDSTITKYQYQQKTGTAAWGSWTNIPDSGATTTSHTVTGLENGTAYRFRLRAVNAAGNGPQSDIAGPVTPGKPAKPANFAATGVELGLRLTWSDPGDSSIVKYQYRISATASWTAWTDMEGSGATTTGYTVENLPVRDFGTPFRVQVRAVNAVGNGVQSDVVSAAPTLPAIGGLSASPGSDRVTLTWTNPASCAEPLCRYEVSYRVKDGTWGAWDNSIGAQTSHTVTGLTPGTEYEFLVHRFKSVNILARGVVTVRTAAGSATVAPAKPAGLSAQGGDGSVTLRWTNLRDATIVRWEYRQKEGTGGAYGEWTAAGSSADPGNLTIARITGLENGTTYFFRLRAVNAIGNGVQSDEVSATPTASPLPAKPADLAARAGAGRVALSWTDPRDASIEKWQVSRDEGVWTDIAGSGASTVRHTVTGLENGTIYEFRVRAVNASGAGPASDAVSVTPASSATPLAPASLRALTGDGVVVLRWAFAADLAVTRWQVSRDGGAWTDIAGSGTATRSWAATGLENGTAYRFRIRAVSAAGAGAESEAVSATPSAEALPMVASVAVVSSPENGDTYHYPERIVVEATFNTERIAVSGIPTLDLHVGAGSPTPTSDGAIVRVANFSGVSGKNRVRFSYQVVAADRDTDGVAVPANAIDLVTDEDNIWDPESERSADLQHDALPAQAGHEVWGLGYDRTLPPPPPPVLKEVVMWSLPESDWTETCGPYTYKDRDGNDKVGNRCTNVRDPDDSYEPGETILLGAIFLSTHVDVHGSPGLKLTVGQRERVAAYNGKRIWVDDDGVLKTVLWFSYPVQEGDVDTDGVSVPANPFVTDYARRIDSSWDRSLAVLTFAGLPAQGGHKVAAGGGAAQHRSAPEMSSGEVLGASLSLGFDRALDPSSVPSANSFKVLAAGGAREVAAVSVNADAVTLELGLPVGAGDAVTVGYTPPSGSGRLRGAEGADVAAFSGQAVTNDTPSRQVAAGLTASVSQAPPEHRGKGTFWLRIAFSEAVTATPQDAAVQVTGGTLLRAARVDKRKDLWRLRVKPSSHGALTVVLPATSDCAAAGAVCTADGRKLGTALTHTVPGPAALSVADARAKEGEDETIGFAVTLSRAASGEVTVRYATRDGTAKKGKDYRKATGTLVFAAGETAKTVSVTVLDDALDEGEETFTLRLSKAKGAVIADGEATGTIANDDPLQKMWLSRFGRTVASHVTDAVSDRLANPLSGAQVTVGGQRVDLAAMAEDEARVGEALTAVARALGASENREPGEGSGSLSAASGWPATGLGGIQTAAPGSTPAREVTGRELLLGSAFHLAREGDGTGPGLAAWGRVTTGGFDGEAPADGGTVRIDGNVTTGILGADAQWTRLLGGVAISVSEGEGSFDQPGVDKGAIESTMTTVSPYARFMVNDRVSVWGLAGWGTGDMTIVQAANENQPERVTRTDLEMRLGAIGGRGALLTQGADGGMDLALKADAFFVETEAQAVSNEGNTTADASRMRLVLEGGRAFAMGNGAMLRPSLELGLRHDGGDAETGTGVELGGGVAYTDPVTGLSVEAKARMLVAHADSNYEEWGVSGAVRLAPGERQRGLSFSLAPTLGATSSAAERLWGARDAGGLAPGGEFVAARGLQGELGYGMALFGDRFTGTPNVGFGLSDSARDYRIGWRLTSAVRGDPGFEVNLDATRRETANDDGPPEHGVMLRGAIRW